LNHVGRRARIIGIGAAWPLIASTGCRSTANVATPEACVPVAGELPAESSMEAASGEYRLRLVATSGSKAGSSVDGTLKLQAHIGELRYRMRMGGSLDSSVVHPLYGTAELNLEAVDAVQVGTIASSDPAAPGVLVIQRGDRTDEAPRAEITLRLGSEANRRNRQRIEGGYTALRVRQVTPTKISGTWASGVVREHSTGYFCAVRKDGKDGAEKDEESN
jgi:hypothetical protein